MPGSNKGACVLLLQTQTDRVARMQEMGIMHVGKSAQNSFSIDNAQARAAEKT